MKSTLVLSVAALAAIVSLSAKAEPAPAAAAGYDILRVGGSAFLDSCGGTVSINNGANDDQINVVFKGVKECSQFDITNENGGYVGDYNAKRLTDSDSDDTRSGSFTIPAEYINLGLNTVTLKIASKSGKHADYITVVYSKSYRVDIYNSPVKSLYDCGGTVGISNGGNDNQVILNFQSVDNCSNFDLIGDDGSFVSDYQAKKLQGENGNRYGSFTIPASYVHFGTNSLQVVVRSNSGKHSDTVNVVYNAGYKIN